MWLTNKETGGKFNTDWIDEDEKKKHRQIKANKEEADSRNSKSNTFIGDDNLSVSDEKDLKDFGKPGIYKAYRSGDIFDSPLGYLSFGMARNQSYIYSQETGKPIEKYEIEIKKPYVVTGNDIDEMQDVVTRKFAGESFIEKSSSLEKMHEITRRAAKELEKQGYDAVLLHRINSISGLHTYEINLLNRHKKSARKKGEN